MKLTTTKILAFIMLKNLLEESVTITDLSQEFNVDSELISPYIQSLVDNKVLENFYGLTGELKPTTKYREMYHHQIIFTGLKSRLDITV